MSAITVINILLGSLICGDTFGHICLVKNVLCAGLGFKYHPSDRYRGSCAKEKISSEFLCARLRDLFCPKVTTPSPINYELDEVQNSANTYKSPVDATEHNERCTVYIIS